MSIAYALKELPKNYKHFRAETTTSDDYSKAPRKTKVRDWAYDVKDTAESFKMQTKIKSAEEAWTRGFVKQAVTAGLTEKQAFAILPAWGGSDWVTKRKMGLRGTAGYNYLMGVVPVPQIGAQFGTDVANMSLSGPIPSLGFGSGIPKDYSGKVDYNPPSLWKLLSDHRDKKNRKEKRAYGFLPTNIADGVQSGVLAGGLGGAALGGLVGYMTGRNPDPTKDHRKRNAVIGALGLGGLGAGVGGVVGGVNGFMKPNNPPGYTDAAVDPDGWDTLASGDSGLKRYLKETGQTPKQFYDSLNTTINDEGVSHAFMKFTDWTAAQSKLPKPN